MARGELEPAVLLAIGVASYGNPVKLRATLESIQRQTVSDYRLFVIHNPGAAEDDAAREVIKECANANSRIVPIWMAENKGYVGAVNALLELGGAEYIAYTDNDVEIKTHGWDQQSIGVLEANADAGWCFPGSGHFGMHNGRYHECLWNAGYCWVLKRSAQQAMKLREVAMFSPYYIRAGFMNEKLGHHEEVDYMTRLRLAGYNTAACPSVEVLHHETATRSDDGLHKPGGRIHDGVVRWMNFWNRYFNGDGLAYSMTAYDARATRYTDWPPNALYLERYFRHHFPTLNDSPRAVNVPNAGVMDAIEILKPKGCYVGRAI